MIHHLFVNGCCSVDILGENMTNQQEEWKQPSIQHLFPFQPVFVDRFNIYIFRYFSVHDLKDTTHCGFGNIVCQNRTAQN